MMTEVFIGDLDGPNFNYDNVQANYNGNIPKRIGKRLSDDVPSKNEFFLFVRELIRQGEIPGKQTDWGATVSCLYPEEIYNALKKYYNSKSLGMLEKN